MAANEPVPPRGNSKDAWLRLIAGFKLLKAVLLTIAGAAALELVPGELPIRVDHWARVLAGDRHDLIADTLLQRLLALDERTLRLFSVGTFLYAALFFVEGFGLFRGLRWAELLTIVSTTGFIPIELYEISQRASSTRLAILAINVGIVVYLVRRQRKRVER